MEIKYENINNNTLNKAKLILSKKTCVKEYIEICVKARVCPQCGKEGLKMDDYFNWVCPHTDCDWYATVQ